MSNNYGVKDIKTLEGIEAIRLRSGMYVGSVGPAGVRHITLEIISNAVDEYLNGHCNLCKILVDKDNFITISDNGRGVPFGKAEDGSETLVNVYTKLHTGAKFDTKGESGYNTSGGLNGVGAKATNALSEYFEVSSTRNGKIATAIFKRGELKSYKESKTSNKESGTIVKFKPDEEIFKEGIELDYQALLRQVKELAYLSPGMTFELSYKNNETETINSKNGILDYIKELNKDKKSLTSIFSAETLENRIGVKVVMQYNDTYSDTYKLFTNSIPNSGGTHLTGFRTALTSSINDYARDKKLLKDKDSNITGEELKEGLTLVLSFIMPDPVFSGQTKDVLSSSEARTIVQRLISKEIKIWLEANPKDAKVIVEKALLARAAREKAKKAKDAIRTPKTKKEKFLNLPTKLVDANNKDRSKCELFLSEGDSASSGLIAARDSLTQAVCPLRGKILAVYKANTDKIMNNAEITSIIKAIGLEQDPQTKKLIYDEKKLRYGKIIAACDADPDGDAIKNLLIELFWWLCPEIITNGHFYVAIPPLFRITTSKNEYIYLKDFKALEEYKKENAGKKYLVNRNKGLGEQDADELAECLLNPETRNIKQVIVSNRAEASELIETLMGPSVPPRRQWLIEHSEEAED